MKVSALIAAALLIMTPVTADWSAEDETRAQALMREIRCMVCAGQSIADSDASAAVEMRRFVRETLAAGQSEDAVRQALTERYGEQVLLRPSFSWRNAPLWAAPVIILIIGAGALYSASRAKR